MVGSLILISGFRISRHLPPTVLSSGLNRHHNSILRAAHTPPFTRSTFCRYYKMAEILRRGKHENGLDKGKYPATEGEGPDHGHTLSNSHSHSHGIFGGHSHSHKGGYAHGGGLVETLESGGDRGSRVTLIGLFANVLLTSAKGAAGWFMNSAALLADAGHSLSDLLGDFVVLFSWRLSRRPPSRRYPFGLAKFETVGTGLVAILLIGGALGIGAHSLSLLFSALSEIALTVTAGPLQTALLNVTAAAHNIPAIGQIAHSHAHAHAHLLDPNAAWFAAASVVSKEWLFRITRKVAEQESSPVLLANAYHHRSDAYSSIVALAAILGSGWFPALPLDPVGGLLVSILIFQQGLSILKGAFWEMTDASVPESVLRTLSRSLDNMLQNPHFIVPSIRIHDIRARRAGSQLFVNLSIGVPGELTANQLDQIERQIFATLKAERRDVKEVQIQFKVVS
ncbi:cation efflux family-domain-containing protein [Multifurca ochricompacta]|uniref:Cation efflux family-domain-containing protein n=1 Tax=Multifurca ochricompacta TaxID=376703 RepID=A0AAD4M9M1_9AGAM|nr:cation efflux family-domain-containing protein [Multifurca ochricompacta]